MFGIICSGRAVETQLQQVAPNKFIFQIPDAAKINHLVVFLLPNVTLPVGMAASVYFQVPNKDFEILGGLTNTKPSAIFRINNTSNVQQAAISQSSYDVDEMADDDMSAGSTSAISEYVINLGISIEAEDVVNQAIQQKRANADASGGSRSTAPSNPNDIATLANKIVQHAYNYLSGFAGSDGKVSMKVFNDWWAKFQSKLNANPRFLDNYNE